MNKMNGTAGTEHAFRQWKLRSLRRGRTRALGPVESAKMRALGRSDARHGFPRQIEDGRWLSAALKKELDAYEQFGAEIWGRMQIDMEPLHREAACRIEEILRLRREIAHCRLDAPDRPSPEELTVRRKGEEALTDKQIRDRRLRECKKRAAPFHAKLRAMQDRLRAAEEALGQLRSRIVESDNAARMICARVHDHTQMRIDAYWGEAVRIHPRGDEMPPVPQLTAASAAEQTYVQRHRALYEKLETALAEMAGRDNDDQTEVA